MSATKQQANDHLAATRQVQVSNVDTVRIGSGPSSVVIAAAHGTVKMGNSGIVTIPTEASLPTNAWTGQPIIHELRIKSGQLEFMQTLTLHFQVHMTGSGAGGTVISPANWWFDRILLQTVTGSKTPLQTFYPETMWFNLGFLDHEQLEDVALGENHTPNWRYNNELFFNNESRDIYIPLLGAFPESMGDGLNMRFIDDDLIIHMEMTTLHAISGTGHFAIDKIEAIMEQNDVDDAELSMIKRQDFMSGTHLSQFLEVVDGSQQTIPLVHNRMSPVRLDPFDQKRLAFMLIGVRNDTTTRAAAACMNFADLGPNATIDLQDMAGQSKWGYGTAVPAQYIKQFIMAKVLPADLSAFTNFYILTFSHDEKQAFRGIVNGSMYFPTNTYRLAITPGSTGTFEVQTTTYSAAPATGGVVLSYGGECTASLPIATTVAAATTAFNNLGSVIADGAQATITSGGGSLATAPVFTFNTYGHYQQVRVISDALATAAPAAVGVSTVMTTKGEKGFVDMPNATVGVWGYVYNVLSIASGRLTSFALL